VIQAEAIRHRTERSTSVVHAFRPHQSFARIQLFVADSHALFRQTLRRALEVDGSFQVVGEASDGREALGAIERMRPEIALVEAGLPLLNGLEIAHRVKKAGIGTRVVVLASRSQEPILLRVLFSGVAGCLLKDADFDELVLALRRVHSGQSYLTPRLEMWPMNRLARRKDKGDTASVPDLLTDRERELLQLVAEGYSNREIASQLCLSVKTVEAHKSNICSKLNVRGGVGLVRHAICSGLVAL